MQWYFIVLPLAGFILGAIIFFLAGIRYRKKVAEKEIGSAEDEARRLVNDAIKAGENKKREMLVEGKQGAPGGAAKAGASAAAKGRIPG